MVADINATGLSPTPKPAMDTQNVNKDDNNSSAFADALTTSMQKQEETQTPKTTNNHIESQNTKETNKDNKAQDDKNSVAQKQNTTKTQQVEPNPLTTKPNQKEKDSKSALTKALNGEEIESKLDGIDNTTTTETQDSKNKDSKNAKAQPTALAQTGINTSAIQIDNTKEVANKDKKNEIASEKLDSKELKAKEIEEKIKSLNDVKKEAQARNLNLQKIEITEKGQKRQINPQDLMDRDVLENNKNRLANSLQDKAVGVANSLSKAISNANAEMNDKDKLLAELLNRYDAAANAKRKAENEMEKLQFKIGDGDKSMVIDRNTIQPKSIVDSKLRNEVMQQEFLEKLHEITGDDDLGDMVEANKTNLQNKLTQISKDIKAKTHDLPKTYQGWAQQAQFTDTKDLSNIKDEILNKPLEMNTDKAIDAVIAENMKTDKAKETESQTSKESKKNEEKVKEKTDSKQDVSAVNVKQEVSMKNALARETMRNFASQFKEEIMNYKPPITKINLELNPENLGQVAMTISKKGKDLQVSITSNANVMSMFVQNAQELRQNLMQIGFNNLDLNFNTHDGQGSSEKNKNEDEKKDSLKTQSIEEAEAQLQLGNIPESIEITLPQYA